MAHSEFLSPADAARRLGVSAKALRLYEERGLLTPGRTAAGWRAYGPDDMERAREVVALRQLGLSLDQIGRVMAGDAAMLGPVLEEHQTRLEGQLDDLSHAIARVRDLRTRISTGTATPAEIATLHPPRTLVAAFDLPWPWGGERFELWDIRPLAFLTGPLGSGKTRLAMALADNIPGAAFIGLDRIADHARLASDNTLRERVACTLGWMTGDGATRSDALLALVTALETDGGPLVFDLIEQGLDEPTQLALAAHLRRRGAGARPVFAMTRSSAILDLAAMGPDERVLFCPANHSPPFFMGPYPGAAGYESVAGCLAAPDVRARSEGVIAMRATA